MHDALDGISDARQVPLEVWFRARLAQLPSTGLPEARSHLARCEEATGRSEEWRGLYGEVLLARAVVRARSDDPPSAGAALDAARDTFATYRLPRRLRAAQALQRSLNIDRGQSAHEHD
jgi:hypothetical protein